MVLRRSGVVAASALEKRAEAMLAHLRVKYALTHEDSWDENDAMLQSVQYCCSCDKFGHPRSACPSFHGRARDASNLACVPLQHFGGRYEIVKLGRTPANERVLCVNGRDYFVRRATGEHWNCLIDTLRQALKPPDGIPCYKGYLEGVRADLARHDFPDGPDRVFDVDAGVNYLEFLAHTNAVVRRLVERARGIDRASSSWQPDRFKFVCIDLDTSQATTVPGDGGHEVLFARENGNHFVPLVPCHGRRDAQLLPWEGWVAAELRRRRDRSK